MKTISYFSLLLLMVAASACSKKDNYDPPKEQINGAILYKGDSIYLEYNRVPYQFYQYGFGKTGPVEQAFTQSGVISSLLFNGSYKFIVPNGQGPFLWPKTSGGAPDSLDITVNGSQQLNIEVTPYYMIRNANITASGRTITANCKIEKIITDANAKDIEAVVLYVNQSQYVSEANYLQKPRIPENDPTGKVAIDGGSITDPNNITLSYTVPPITPAQNYVFARFGLKIAGVEDMIFSPLFRLDF